MSYHHAQGHSVSHMDPRGTHLKSPTTKNQQFGPFQDHPQYSKRSKLRKAIIITVESLQMKDNPKSGPLKLNISRKYTSK